MGSGHSPRWHLFSRDRASSDAANTLKPPEALRRAVRGVALLSQPCKVPGTGRVWGWGISPSVLGMGAGPRAGLQQGSGSWLHSPSQSHKASSGLGWQCGGDGVCILWGTASEQSLRGGNRNYGWQKALFQPGHCRLPGWVEKSEDSITPRHGGSRAVG